MIQSKACIVSPLNLGPGRASGQARFSLNAAELDAE